MTLEKVKIVGYLCEIFQMICLDERGQVVYTLTHEDGTRSTGLVILRYAGTGAEMKGE